MASCRWVEIPFLLSKRPVDKRGFPIPYIVLIDKEGKANFKINDDRKVKLCRTEGLCHICGSKLTTDLWLVGGMLSAFHPNGVFVDGPAHYDCCVFALKVCPYMAFSQYQKKEIALPLDADRFYHDPTMTLERLSFFVLAKTKKVSYQDRKPFEPYIVGKRPYLKYELWLDGEQITYDQALAILKEKNEHNYLPQQK
jgi:hypothetical protein